MSTEIQQLIVAIIVGGVAGWLADYVVSGINLSLIGKIIAGIVGGFIGSWLFGLLRLSNAGADWVGSIITAFVGAVILLLILRAIR